MSISVYAMSLNNGSLQNQQSSTNSVTQKEDVKQAELKQNVSAVNMAQDKYREDGTISVAQRTQGTEAYRQIKEGEGNVGEMQNIADRQSYEDNVQMDTVIISEEGRQAYSRMSKQEGEGNEGQDTGSKETENMVEDLSEYTDTELKQMYYRGEITLQEYEDETGEELE